MKYKSQITWRSLVCAVGVTLAMTHFGAVSLV
jgi:hypothetical protein